MKIRLLDLLFAYVTNHKIKISLITYVLTVYYILIPIMYSTTNSLIRISIVIICFLGILKICIWGEEQL